MCEICSDLTIKTLGRRPWRRSGIFNVNYEQGNASWKGSLVSVCQSFWKLGQWFHTK